MEPADRPAILSRDTSAKAERHQVEIWRTLSAAEKLQLFAGASQAVRTMAMAGLRARHPGVSEEDLVPLYARLTLGPELAEKAYPQLAAGRNPDGDRSD